MRISFAFLALLAAFLALPGCSSQQVAATEEDIHTALVAADQAVALVVANPDATLAAIDAAAKLDPNNATLQAACVKARAAVAAGDPARAHEILAAGAALTSKPVVIPSGQ